MDGTREALIVATGAYADPELRRLRAPAQDAAPLARALSDPAIGDFTVRQVIDQPAHVLARAIQQFFAGRGLDDLLLLHISCHGIKDDDGRLYFAASDTEKEWLASTALPARFLSEAMEASRARAIILLLDCCYSGAFMPGSKGDRAVHLNDEFSGRGRAILTASNAIEYAWEGDGLLGEGQPSLFTAAVIDGLETGEADRDRDGVVSVEDLYKHVYERVHEAKRGQTPLLSAVDIEAGLYIARSKLPPRARPDALPADLREAIDSPLASARAGAVVDLVRMLHSDDTGLRAATRQALERLCGDDSQVVSGAARLALLSETPARIVPEPPLTPAGPAPVPALRRSAVVERPAATAAPAPVPAARPSAAMERPARTAAPAPVPAARPSAAMERPARTAAPAPVPAPRPSAAMERPAPPAALPRRTGPAWLRQPRTRVIAAALVLVLLVTAAVVVLVRDRAAPTGGSPPVLTAVDVPADKPWTDTGHDVSAGQRLRIHATGDMEHFTNGYPVGPDGDTRPEIQQYNILAGAPHASLIGKVGAQGQPFLVGSSFDGTMSSTGRLFLSVNDVGLDNNSGKFSARIELQHP